MDPKAKYRPKPRLYALTSAGIIIVELFYFFVVAPYNIIPDKLTFWVAFFAWAAPPIAVEWAYVNAPTKRETNAYTNMMIGIGILAIALGVAVKTFTAVTPIVAALLPGVLAGGLIGSDTTLVWKLRNWH